MRIPEVPPSPPKLGQVRIVVGKTCWILQVPPLKVIAFFAVLKHGQTPPENNPNESVQTVIKVNDQPKDHKTKKLDAQRLQNDIE